MKKEKKKKEPAASTDRQKAAGKSTDEASAKAAAGSRVKSPAEKGSEASGRFSSITRRLHWLLIGKKLAVIIFSEILIELAAILGWIIGQEMAAFGEIKPLFGVMRYFSILKDDGIVYRLSSGGEILLEARASGALHLFSWFVLITLALQIILLVLAVFSEERRLREILNPLNELALQAERLSQLSFTEDKYQLIEEAITRIQPQDTGVLDFEDEDLEGIEAAMNNLLKRMRETYRQQARFVNDASHELRTPIAVIQGHANLLSRWGKKDEKILDESIAAICHESEHMQHLVEQLLFLARGDSGKTALNVEEFSLNDMIRETYEESFMIDEKHRYRLNTVDEEIMVKADRTLLKQAVRILTDNAAKFTPEEEEIVFSYGVQDASSGNTKEFFISVRDNGIGMAEKDVEHIFERFYRSDEVRNTQGTGLGLSIAKWIVDKHKGHFEILSREGLGTRISICIPWEEEKELPAKAG